jgi:hypothetical protein
MFGNVIKIIKNFQKYDCTTHAKKIKGVFGIAFWKCF